MKLFRKRRYNLIKDNKTKKYLKYAIGEILLVVIGILIALQINNWNERIQLKKKEINTLKSLQESIKINSSEYKKIFNAQILRNSSLQTVILNDVSNMKVEDLDSIIKKIVVSHTFDPSTGIYNSMINSGKIELITNDSLKNRISKLYDRVKDYQESEDEVTEFSRENLESYFINNYIIDPRVLAELRERTEKEKQKDLDFYIKTFESQKVKNMYILLLNKMRDIITKGENLQSEYNSLVRDLEVEIQNRI